MLFSAFSDLFLESVGTDEHDEIGKKLFDFGKKYDDFGGKKV